MLAEPWGPTFLSNISRVIMFDSDLYRLDRLDHRATSRASRQVIFGDRLGEVGPLHSCPACGHPECWGCQEKKLGLRRHGAGREIFSRHLSQPTARYAPVPLRQPRCFFACVSYRWPIAPSAAPSSEKVLPTWSDNFHAAESCP